MIDVPSPAISIVGRHNSGKTTLIEPLIAELVRRGFNVGSIKHHSHSNFDIDYPGKDSYRHRAAGATETVIASPSKLARIKTLDHEVECSDIVQSMPGHDIVVVEGYRKSGLPTIEIMRSGNAADVNVAHVFAEGARAGVSLDTDFTQLSRGDKHFEDDIINKMPTSDTVAVVTDIAEASEAATLFGIPSFDLEAIGDLANFLEEHYVRPRISVVIQAGGESKRMGRSKATVPFEGRPLICRLVERLSPVADELIITTNEAQNLEFLSTMYPDLNIALVKDEFDYRGALPGVYTALNAAHNPYVALVACDMVFASASLVVAESIEMAETNADVVVPVNKHGYEPFHAMYRRSGCIDAINRALERGDLRAQSFFDDDDVLVVEFSQERVLQAEPRGGCFINANTPDELKRLEDSYLGE